MYVIKLTCAAVASAGIGILGRTITLKTLGPEAGFLAIGDGLRPKPTSGPLSRPLPPGERRFAVEGLKEQMIASSRPALRVIAIAVGAVLLIVCANVAGLLLARGTARQREVAVRLAIGASRGCILRQFITESLVLTGIGGALPAFRMSRIDHTQVMNYRGAGGQGGARRGDTRARSVLVVAQMIVATMLLVGAAC